MIRVAFRQANRREVFLLVSWNMEPSSVPLKRGGHRQGASMELPFSQSLPQAWLRSQEAPGPVPAQRLCDRPHSTPQKGRGRVQPKGLADHRH